MWREFVTLIGAKRSRVDKGRLFGLIRIDIRGNDKRGAPMSENDLNTLGLICNLAGVGLAFFFGFPHPEDVKVHRVKHLLWSRAGLALLFIGFVLQLGSIWVATNG